ncbi:alpha/beta hydrolase [Novosphingobium sp. Gsoil 351]|uniref:alpha/beta hydrolase n=1 Tax=Novosphingobium sp. Gsoil 351 TaxID=2675225 RepID=UPI001E2E222F|nr:alpha/beta hydrolase [Novosphingobium sp. Gsoil 351]
MNDTTTIEPPTQTGHYTRPDVRGFLDFLNSIEGPQMHEMPLAEARGAYLAMVPVGELDPRPLAVIRDLTCPGPAGDIPLRFYDARETREPGPAIVFYHGGGFTIGDLDTHHALCTEIAAEMDLPVVAVHYRLAPEHAFPAAPDDCEAATRWVAESPAELGRKVTGLIPIGDSAGGNLTIVMTQALMERPAAAPVVLQVPIYPLSDEKPDHVSMLDFAEGHLLTKTSMDWFSECYGAVPGNTRAYPIHGDHAKMPPTVLVTASLDPIRDSGRVYGAQLILAGSDVVFLEMKGSIHGFTTLRKALPSAQADMQRIFAAMRLMLGNA